MTTRVVRAPAKVNLMLRVLDREPSGYHRLVTLFCALELADELVISVGGEGENGQETDGIRLVVHGADLGDPDDNLVARAARAFFDAAGVEPRASIQLTKRIPAGAGLGGGSSDAASTLLALDALLPGRVQRDALERIGRDLGSDVPFFMTGAALARGEGRGEVLSVAEPLDRRPVVLAVPSQPVATGDAYGWLDADREGAASDPGSDSGRGGGRDHASAGWDVPAPDTWADVEPLAVNDFEWPVFARMPLLRSLRDRLRQEGARIALLAGSGSTVFGVFDDQAAAEAAAVGIEAEEPGVRAIVTHTAAR